MTYEDILYEERGDRVARISINRPDRMNAFRGQTVDELIHAFQRSGWNREIAFGRQGLGREKQRGEEDKN